MGAPASVRDEESGRASESSTAGLRTDAALEPTRFAHWPFFKDRVLRPRGIRIGFCILSVVYGIAYSGLAFIIAVQANLFGASGASEGSIVDSNIASDGNMTLAIAWIVVLPFVPLLLDMLGGPRNGVVVCLFTWATCSLLFLVVWSERSTASKWACSIINGLLAGASAPLGFTGTAAYAERAAVLLARMDFEGKSYAEKDGRPPATKSEIIVARREREGELMDRLVGIMMGTSQVVNLLIQIPSAIGLLNDATSRNALYALVAYSSLLFLAALICLLVPTIPEQDHGLKSQTGRKGGKAGCFDAGGVGTKLLSVGLALCEYRGMAFLAIGGWFFFQGEQISVRPPWIDPT